MLQAIIQLGLWKAGRMFQPYLEHPKPDLHVELNEHWSFVFDNSPVATKKLPQGTLSGKDMGEGSKGQAVSFHLIVQSLDSFA